VIRGPTTNGRRQECPRYCNGHCTGRVGVLPQRCSFAIHHIEDALFVMTTTFHAGAAVADLTPCTSQFLCGYPHVERMSEGVHDPLYSSALCLDNGTERVLLIANDLLFIPNPSVPRIRNGIARETGIPVDHILVSATHTHSGPNVAESVFHRNDPVVPPVDQAYVSQIESAIIRAGCNAAGSTRPCRLAVGFADSTGIGTNRHDPNGPADHQVPVLVVRGAATNNVTALMLVCSMHPTVMHEDSRLVSADFPGACRQYLQQPTVTGSDCVILHHTGCAGNQSPRHVTRGNTFAEADRIGCILGRAVEQAIANAEPMTDVTLGGVSAYIDPPRRQFPSVAAAETDLRAVRARFAKLTRTGPPTEARTAECDVFGAEHRLNAARMIAEDGLEPAYAACTPAEIQVLRIGNLRFVGWPAETYVEYGLRLKTSCPNTFPIAIANGCLTGYITTRQAAAAGHYESGAAFFAPETGDLFVETSMTLIDR